MKFQSMNLYEFNQVRFILTAEATGYLDTVELSVEFQKANLEHVEVWVRMQGDNVKGKIREFAAKSTDTESDSFHQSLITQVNEMEDIGDYIDAWIFRRRKEKAE